MPASQDAVLDALLHPFVEGRIVHDADTLFMNARPGGALPDLARAWTCVQSFKPLADALEASGLVSLARVQEDAHRYARVLLPMPRQRDLSRASLVRGLRRLAPGGVMVISQANDAGARSACDDFARLVGPAEVESKFHCRVAWAQAGRLEPALQDQWLAQAEPGRVPATPWLAQAGVFAKGRIDAGSALLAECLPPDIEGAVADLGAGWGFLSASLLQRCPGIRSVDLFEADADALALAEVNLASLSPAASCRFHWQDVRRGVPAGFDVVVSNPPFHVGGADDPQVGRDFIAAAARALRPGGRFWMVANRHLPYEQALAGGFAQVREVARREGFKVFEARVAA